MEKGKSNAVVPKRWRRRRRGRRASTVADALAAGWRLAAGKVGDGGGWLGEHGSLVIARRAKTTHTLNILSRLGPPPPRPPPARTARRTPAIMSRQYQHGDSDAEDESMGAYPAQYDGEDLDRMPSISSNHDIHAQLQAAATPLEFQATLETKFASYDNYCNLFHYILNSDGPVDLEVPNVSPTRPAMSLPLPLPANPRRSTTGHGTSSTSSSTSSTASAATARRPPSRTTTRKSSSCCAKTQTHGAATASSTSSTRSSSAPRSTSSWPP
jgi:hypothetical protein